MSVVFRCEKKADYKVFIDLLYDYVNELHDIDDSVRLRDKKTLKKEYLSNIDEDNQFYLIYDNNMLPAGFAVVGVNNYCHPQADIYINEFYIKPEYRLRGYGDNLFSSICLANLLFESGNKICMYILKNNTRAIQFWSGLLKRNGWLDVTEDYYNDTPDNLYWYMYKKL